MRTAPLPHGEAARDVQSRRAASRGFSLVELLVTIVLAGIIFAAMVPFFANALKRTSGDRYRVDSTNIAQDRIEQVRLLAYSDITANNLNYSPSPAANPFGDDRFGPSYKLAGQTTPFTITYVVTPQTVSGSSQKYVKVSVSRPGMNYTTTADAIVKDPAEGDTSLTDSAPTNLTMKVYFDTVSYVVSPGVTMQCVETDVTPNVTTSPTPVSPPGAIPNATYPNVVFTGLAGGPNYTYTLMCRSSKATYTMVAPPFRMWSNGTLKFDTYPGGD